MAVMQYGSTNPTYPGNYPAETKEASLINFLLFKSIILF